MPWVVWLLYYHYALQTKNSQKRAWPQGTTKQTSHVVHASASAAAVCDAVADGKQELESRIQPVVELGQTAITWNVYCDDESQVLKSANV